MKKNNFFRTFAAMSAVGTMLAMSLPAHADINVATIVELTGPGSTAGSGFRNGLDLAIKDINAAGGILGQKVTATVYDTQTNPGVAKGLTKRAVDQDVFAIFGPVFTGSIMVSMTESQRGQIPNFVGGEGTAITQQSNKYVFRTSLTQADAIPKVVKYINDDKKLNTIAVIYGNNDFGKGGRDAFIAAMKGARVKVVADISTDQGQVDFSAPVLRAKQSNADAVFAYMNEEESARLLRELRKQGWDKPIIGETTLTSQKVIDMAGNAANGAVAHVGLTADAKSPLIQDFRKKYETAYKHTPDHNGIKGYTSIFLLKAAIEKAGKLDRAAVTKALHGLSVKTSQQPGVLLDVTIDDKGDLNRESFMTEVINGRQEVVGTLPPLQK